MKGSNRIKELEDELKIYKKALKIASEDAAFCDERINGLLVCSDAEHWEEKYLTMAKKKMRNV